MKKPYTHLLVACLVVMAMQCCKTDPIPINPIDQLPPATQTGANTFGCLVNGEAFVVTNTSNMVAIYQGGLLQIGGKIENSDIDKSISIRINDSNLTKKKYGMSLFPENRSRFISKISNLYCRYEFENTFYGFLELSHIDDKNFVIAGMFEFSTVTQDCDTIRITDGRFDMQYIP